MRNEVLCNGAGEMPGREGEGSSNDEYGDWVDNNEEEIVDKYKDSIESIKDVPEEFIFSLYESK